MVELEVDDGDWVASTLRCSFGCSRVEGARDSSSMDLLDKVSIALYFWDDPLRAMTNTRFPFDSQIACQYIAGDVSAADIGLNLKSDDETVSRLAVLFTRMRELEGSYEYDFYFFVSPSHVTRCWLRLCPVHQRSPEAEAAYNEEYDRAYPLIHDKKAESLEDLFAIFHYVAERMEERGFGGEYVDLTEKDWFVKDNELNYKGTIPLSAIDTLYDLAVTVGKQC